MSLNNNPANTLIFTDLDGTLLEHHSYRFDAALPMLSFIKARNIPLIIVTSKTVGEVIELQQKLGIREPFIAENGAGIAFPKNDGYEELPLGKSYTAIRDAFTRYAAQFPIRGFFDMSVEEVARLTGLPMEQAALAKARTFTEPFVLEKESRLDELIRLADADGLAIVKGGRFYHLITKGQDKAAAIKQLIKQYETRFNCRFETVALGDGPNDLTMLAAVDHPVLIPHPDGRYEACNIDNLAKASNPGPKGWNAALKAYFHVS